MRRAAIVRLFLVLAIALPPLDSLAAPSRAKVHPCCKTTSCSMMARRAAKAECSWNECDSRETRVLPRAGGIVVPASMTAFVDPTVDIETPLVVRFTEGVRLGIERPPRLG